MTACRFGMEHFRPRWYRTPSTKANSELLATSRLAPDMLSGGKVPVVRYSITAATTASLCCSTLNLGGNWALLHHGIFSISQDRSHLDEWTGCIVCRGQLTGLSGEGIGVVFLSTWPVGDVKSVEARSIDFAPPTCMLP